MKNSRFFTLRAHLPAVLVVLAFVVVLFGYLPGAADPAGGVRVAVALALLLVAAALARDAVLARLKRRPETVAVGVFIFVILLSLVRAPDAGRAFWGSSLLWTSSASLYLSSALFVIIAPAAITGRWRAALPAVLVGLLSIHQALFLIRTFVPQFVFPSAQALTLAAAAPTAVAFLSVAAALVAIGETLRRSISARARILWTAAAVLHLAVLIRADRPAAWAACAIGLAVLLALAVRRFDQVSRPAANAAFAACALAVVLMFVRIPAPLAAALPAEINLSQRDAFVGLVSLWRIDPLAAAIGTSPAGFESAFGRVRPESLNRTTLWNIRFPVPPSTLLLLFYDLGFVAAAAFVTVIAVSLHAGWQSVSGQPSVKGIRRVFARRASSGDVLPAAGMLAAAAGLGAAAALHMLPAAGMLLLALIAGWLLARTEGEAAARADGGRPLVSGWIATGLIICAAAVAGTAVWSALGERAFGAVLTAPDLVSADRAYAAAARYGISPELHGVAALQAMLRVQTAESRDAAMQAWIQALARARAAARGGTGPLEAAITVGMQAARAGADVPELDAWIAAASAREPSNPTFAIARGDLRDLQGDVAAAETAYRDAIRLAPTLLGVRSRLAGLLERAGRIDEAVKVAQDGVAAAPLDAGGLDLLAQFLARRGTEQDLTAAETLLRRATKLVSGDPVPYVRLAELLAQRGRTAEAKQWYEAAAALAPDNQEIRQRIDALSTATSTPATP